MLTEADDNLIKNILANITGNIILVYNIDLVCIINYNLYLKTIIKLFYR